MAGRTPAALVIPEVMAYTKIIGTPVITGLYTLFLPVLVAARKRLETGDLAPRTLNLGVASIQQAADGSVDCTDSSSGDRD